MVTWGQSGGKGKLVTSFMDGPYVLLLVLQMSRKSTKIQKKNTGKVISTVFKPSGILGKFTQTF